MIYHHDEWLDVHIGDCREALRDINPGTIDCCVTSPPYWGLRDYGHRDQLGSEATPDEYVANMVAVFRLVRDTLKDDGSLWLNLGDTYASRRFGDIKAKDLVGIPWRVALALQSDGWYLRSDVIWSKPNPMPEPAHDRPSRSHEYVFQIGRAHV